MVTLKAKESTFNSSRITSRLLQAAVLTAVLVGCDRTDEMLQKQSAERNVDGHLVATSSSAAALVDECRAAYSRLHSYEDTAYVELTYKLDGTKQVDRAPLSIAWSKGEGIGLRVYSVVAGPSGDRWMLRLTDSEGEIPNQVLMRTIPAKIDFDWLLSDPIVSSKMSAGLAGFPPQLDLLLSDKPFAGLIGSATAIKHGAPTSIDGKACHAIVVKRGENEYGLVIDQSTMLLRRMLMPSEVLPPEMMSDTRISDVSLTIEFENARTNQRIAWQRFEVSAEAGETLVNKFVPKQAVMEVQGVGEQTPAFRLSSPAGKVVFDSSRQAKASVLLWLADHPSSQLAAEQLASTAASIASMQLDQEVTFVPIWAAPTPPAGETYETLVDSWRLPGQLATDTDALGRDLFEVAEAPTMIVLDASNRVQLRVTKANPLVSQILPRLLQRIVQGEDIAASLLKENDELRARYENELHMATTLAGRVGNQATIYSSYAPIVATLEKTKTISHSRDVISVCVDASDSVWMLTQEGTLQHFANGLTDQKSPAEYSTGWSPTDGASLELSPESSYAATWHPNSNELAIFNIRTGQNRTVTLEPGESPIDVEWTGLRGGQSSRLAIITGGNQLILLDPMNHEQLSGRCPAPPMAILSQSSQNSVVAGQVVLRDRTVQPIQLSTDSAHHNFPLLAKPASFKPGSMKGISSPPRVSFQPAEGPWSVCKSQDASTTLARGWIAPDEPGLFMLNQELAPQWHYRVALQPKSAAAPMVVTAIDPTTGLPTWIFADGEKTLHILRADGLTDHFRVGERFVGLSLLASGTALNLGVVSQTSTEIYSIHWNQLP